MASANVQNILIVGASFAGLSEAHYLLRHILPAVSQETSISYKVTLLSTSSHFYFKIASPRVVVSPSLISPDDVFLPIAEGFKDYDKSSFEFVLGTATRLDAAARTLLVTGLDGKEFGIAYGSLVIATGTTSNSPVWSLVGTPDITRKLLETTHAAIVKAQSVLIAGGGAVGVETAGELGSEYAGKKEVTILSGATRLLPRLNAKTSASAESKLKALGVTVMHKVRVVSDVVTDDGKTHLKLSNGTEATVDVYLNATGWVPNTKYLPAEWLDERGYVKTDEATLRVKVEGVKGVYAYGSITDFGHGGIMDVFDAVKPVADSIRLDLLAAANAISSKSDLHKQPAAVHKVTWWTWLMSLFSGPVDPSQRKATFKQTTKELQLVPIGRNGGVGVLFGWRIPSIMVYMIKGKDYMISAAQDAVTGKAYMKA
ncbi:MAG: hypothetical protein M1818_007236 [Claussenomyces sp. TS43310]|nr:MAG: hypothetical protein M1818_007236 [Claussenomyces sp. TS43310]